MTTIDVTRRGAKSVGHLTGFISGSTMWCNSAQPNRAPRQVTAKLSTDNKLIHVWIGSEINLALEIADWRTIVAVILNEVLLVEDVRVP